MNTDVKILNKILVNQVQECIGRNIPQSSGIHLGYARLVQHLKMNQCDPLYQQARVEKSHNHIN